MERMALRDSLHDQPEGARQGAARQGLLGVRGAAGLEPAGARQSRRDGEAIETNQGNEDPARPEGRRGRPGSFAHEGSRFKRVPISAWTWVSVARAQELRAIQTRQTARSRTSAAT